LAEQASGETAIKIKELALLYYVTGYFESRGSDGTLANTFTS